MNETSPETPGRIHRAIDTKAFEHPPMRKYRAAAFQAYVLIASVVFVALAVGAHYVPYFRIDLLITRAFQSYQGEAFDALMRGMSWVGFVPQVDLLIVLMIAILFLLGLRWEAVAAMFAALGPVIGSLIKLIVARPRPSADVVHVLRRLDTLSFPSGHVLLATAFYGFIAFLIYALLKPGLLRTILLVIFGLFIALMGPSRIYLGQHWFSDVMGAYVLGSLWLALSVRVYRWGKSRFFRSQPVAAEAPIESAGRL
ncbi:MAG TPA: phosphatase PAP2 family protein [Candidatus Eisenbacteria bacterium]|nr:phosphatase PAP2 family protein [Candidatus Eisenbacteria bacterium]